MHVSTLRLEHKLLARRSRTCQDCGRLDPQSSLAQVSRKCKHRCEATAIQETGVKNMFEEKKSRTVTSQWLRCGSDFFVCDALLHSSPPSFLFFTVWNRSQQLGQLREEPCAIWVSNGHATRIGLHSHHSTLIRFTKKI